MALGILTVLTLMAVTFASIMRVEQRASANYAENAQAQVFFHSAVNKASTALSKHLATAGHDSPRDVWIPGEEGVASSAGSGWLTDYSTTKRFAYNEWAGFILEWKNLSSSQGVLRRRIVRNTVNGSGQVQILVSPALPTGDGYYRILAPSFCSKGNYDAGYVTAGGGSSRIVDSNKRWAVNQWVGYRVIMTGGALKGQWSTIIANDASNLYLQAMPSVSSGWYYIHPAEGPDAVIPKDMGRASSGGANWIESNSATYCIKDWQTDQWVGFTVTIAHRGGQPWATSGTADRQSRRIVSNTGVRLTVDRPWNPTPNNSYWYCIHAPISDMFSTDRRKLTGSALRILDTAAKIYLNTPTPDSASRNRLVRLLENLGAAIVLTQGATTNPIAAGEGTTIVNARNALPGGCFLTKEQLKTVSAIDDADYELLEEFVTATGYTLPETRARAWESSILNLLEDYLAREAYVTSNTIVGCKATGWTNSPAAYTLDEDVVGAWAEVVVGDFVEIVAGRGKGQIRRIVNAVPSGGPSTIQVGAPWTIMPEDTSSRYRIYSLNPASRAPVNVNTASLEVLTAAFGNLEGVVDWKTWPPPSLATVDVTTAASLALETIKQRNRRPFTDWESFERWLTTGAVGAGVITASQANLLAAAVEPATGPIAHNPDNTWSRSVTKLDVTKATTELCFKSRGLYDLSVTGTLISPREDTQTEADAGGVLDIANTWHQDRQDDFGRFLEIGVVGLGQVRGTNTLQALEPIPASGNSRFKVWRNGEWNGKYVVILAGPGQGQVRRITATTGYPGILPVVSTITVQPAWSEDLAADDSVYAIVNDATSCPERLVVADRGVVTGETTTTLTKAATWGADQWNDLYQVIIVDGIGNVQSRRIIDTTSSTLTVDRPWDGDLRDDSSSSSNNYHSRFVIVSLGRHDGQVGPATVREPDPAQPAGIVMRASFGEAGLDATKSSGQAVAAAGSATAGPLLASPHLGTSAAPPTNVGVRRRGDLMPDGVYLEGQSLYYPRSGNFPSPATAGTIQLWIKPNWSTADLQGSITTPGADSLQDTNRSWVPGQWLGTDVVLTAGGGGASGHGQVRRVVRNSINTLYVTQEWSPLPSASLPYALAIPLFVLRNGANATVLAGETEPADRVPIFYLGIEGQNLIFRISDCGEPDRYGSGCAGSGGTRLLDTGRSPAWVANAWSGGSYYVAIYRGTGSAPRPQLRQIDTNDTDYLDVMATIPWAIPPAADSYYVIGRQGRINSYDSGYTRQLTITQRSLQDTGQSWTVNELRGKNIIVADGAQVQVRSVVSNTDTTIWIDGEWRPIPSTDSVYIISDDGAAVTGSAVTLTRGKWHHIAAVWSGLNSANWALGAYVDGTQVAFASGGGTDARRLETPSPLSDYLFLGCSPEVGTATAGSNINQIRDDTKAWRNTTNWHEWKGLAVSVISGTAAGQTREIFSNPNAGIDSWGDTLTVNPTNTAFRWDPAPVAGDVYTMHAGSACATIDEFEIFSSARLPADIQNQYNAGRYKGSAASPSVYESRPKLIGSIVYAGKYTDVADSGASPYLSELQDAAAAPWANDSLSEKGYYLVPNILRPDRIYPISGNDVTPPPPTIECAGFYMLAEGAWEDGSTYAIVKPAAVASVAWSPRGAYGPPVVFDFTATALAQGSGEPTAAAGPSYLIDDTKAWEPNQWAGFAVWAVDATGGGGGKVRHIVSNTSNTLYIWGNWSPGFSPDPGDIYQIFAKTGDAGVATSGATGGATGLLADTAKARGWNPNEWFGFRVVIITDGISQTDVGTITANDTTSLAFDYINTGTHGTPNGRNYLIRPARHAGTLTTNCTAGGNWVIDTHPTNPNLSWRTDELKGLILNVNPWMSDNDNDGQVDEDWVDGVNNDGDGYTDEDPPHGMIITGNTANTITFDGQWGGYVPTAGTVYVITQSNPRGGPILFGNYARPLVEAAVLRYQAVILGTETARTRNVIDDVTIHYGNPARFQYWQE